MADETIVADTVDFAMPSLGSDMDSGTVIRWRVGVGDRVEKGDIVVDIDTEKSEIEVEVWDTGVISEIVVEPGVEVPVGTTLARVDVNVEPDADRPVVARPSATATPPHEKRSPPAAPPRPRDLAASAARDRHADDVFPSPRTVYWPTTSVPRIESPAVRSSEKARPRRRQAAVADKMARSNREIPHFFLSAEIDFGIAQAWLDATNAELAAPDRILPAAMLLRATALAAANNPSFNGTWGDAGFSAAAGVDLGVAVNVRGGGLLTPVLANAENTGLRDLMARLRDVVGRVRAGKLRAADAGSPSLTVTNLGNAGADSVLGLIQPPQVALVGFGRIRQRPIAENGSVVVRPTVVATLAADHRANNGQRGAAFLADIDKYLRLPETL